MANGDEQEEAGAPGDPPPAVTAPLSAAATLPDREGKRDSRVDSSDEDSNSGGQSDLEESSTSPNVRRANDAAAAAPPKSSRAAVTADGGPPDNDEIEGGGASPPSPSAGTDPPPTGPGPRGGGRSPAAENADAGPAQAPLSSLHWRNTPGAYRIEPNTSGGGRPPPALGGELHVPDTTLVEVNADAGPARAPLSSLHSLDGELHVPDTTLVEEQEVYHGTPLEPPAPLLPWWEQTRARLVLGAGGLTLIVLSIAVGVLLSSDNSTVPEVGSIKETPPPSISMVPSTSPPSISVVGLFETDCDSCDPHVAIHGDTAVVARDYVDVQFFSTTNSSFELVTQIDIDFVASAAVVNGNTAVIGSYAGINSVVYIYQRDQSGTWSQAMRIQPADLGTIYFGWALDIDGNIIVLGAYGTAYVYRRNESTWVQEAKLSPPDGYVAETFGEYVTVKGTSIGVGDPEYKGSAGLVFVYVFDPSSKSWTPVGVPLMNDDCAEYFGSIVQLSNDGHLMVSCGEYWKNWGGAVYYYAKEGMYDDYVLQQSIRFDGAVWSLELDNNAMVLSEYSSAGLFVVHFFARQNNAWEDVAKIDGPAFDMLFGYRVRLFGNTILISSRTNVYHVGDVEVGR